MFGSSRKRPPLPLSSGPADATLSHAAALGLVHGCAVVGVNVWKETIAAVTDVFGGRSSSIEATVDKGIGLALQTMQERALARGADGIVEVRVDVEQMGGRGGRGGHLIIVAVGTAVGHERPGATVPPPAASAPTAGGLPPFRPGT